jgi:hypothetical protein
MISQNVASLHLNDIVSWSSQFDLLRFRPGKGALVTIFMMDVIRKLIVLHANGNSTIRSIVIPHRDNSLVY